MRNLIGLFIIVIDILFGSLIIRLDVFANDRFIMHLLSCLLIGLLRVVIIFLPLLTISLSFLQK
jgi:hypothetical protein